MIDLAAFKKDFIDRYGSEPRVFRAPARVNLIGEHTDYNDGFVLPFAIEKAVYVAAAPRQDARVTVASQSFPDVLDISVDELQAIETPSGWTRYPFGVISLIDRAGHELAGADLLVTSDIPLGAGLSSSSALEVGIAIALKHLFELDLSEIDIARVGRQTENDFAGVNSGIMDQMASVLGRARHALFLDCRSLEWQHIPIDRASFLVCDTRTKHSLAESEYNTRRHECEEAAVGLGKASLRDARLDEIEGLPSPPKERARHVISENARVRSTIDALNVGDLNRVGELIDESHASLRDDFQVSCRELDTMAEICRSQEEVLGSRMMGGGFGGCTISICTETADITEIAIRIASKYSAEIGVEPSIFACRPMDGASEIIGQTN